MADQDHFISTVDGELTSSDQISISIILPHEHVFQTLSSETSGVLADISEITLETIMSIRKNPFRCLRNMALNSIEEAHLELQQLLPDRSNNVKQDQQQQNQQDIQPQQQQFVCVLESTSSQNGQDLAKMKEISALTGIKLIRGITFPPLLKPLAEDKAQVLFSSQNIYKQLTYELDIGADTQKPAFIGEIELFPGSQKNVSNGTNVGIPADSEQVRVANLIHKNSLIAYLHLSEKRRIPVFFELNQQIEESTNKKIAELCEQVKQDNRILCVLFNPKIVFSSVLPTPEDILKGNAPSISQKLCNFEDILDLFKKGFTVGFDVLRYDLQQLSLVITLLLSRQYHKQILLSSGVKFKSDLTKYGGLGYNAVLSLLETIQKQDKNIVTAEQFKDIAQGNVLRLLNWNSHKVEIEKEVTLWTCPQCNKQHPDTIEKFTKFGREFCSIGCLKKAVK